MDKKLLLTIQSVCNSDGIKLPWDKIGEIMGDQISDGAVIQHLAKLRQRMVSQGLSVPPPLRRGGGNAISTTTSGSANRSAASKKMRARKGPESPDPVDENDEDEEDFDVDEASDSEEEFGRAQSKRMKRKPNAKGRSTKVTREDSGEDDAGTSYLVGDKRKRESNVPVKPEERLRTKFKKEQIPKKLTKRARTRRAKDKSTMVADSYDDVDEDSDPNTKEDDACKPTKGKSQFVASGAEFLKLDESERGSEDEVQTTHTQFSGKSGITVLRFDSQRAKSILRKLESTAVSEQAEMETIYSHDSNDSDEDDQLDEDNQAAEDDQADEDNQADEDDQAVEDDQADEDGQASGPEYMVSTEARIFERILPTALSHHGSVDRPWNFQPAAYFPPAVIEAPVTCGYANPQYLPREMTHPSSHHNGLNSHHNNLIPLSSCYGYNIQGHLSETPLVPIPADYSGVMDSLSGTTTNFNPTPWTTSPVDLDYSGAQNATHDGGPDEPQDEVRFSDFLVPMDDVNDDLDIQ